MSPRATDDAMSYCARIRDLILTHPGGWADLDALQRFWQLSGAAERAADDTESSELLRAAGQYAADLFSRADHYKWARGSTSGADVLRLCILGRLDAFRDRVRVLLAFTRGAKDARGAIYPWDE